MYSTSFLIYNTDTYNYSKINRGENKRIKEYWIFSYISHKGLD